MRKWELDPVAAETPKQSALKALIELVRDQPGIPIVAAAWILCQRGVFPPDLNWRTVKAQIASGIYDGTLREIRKEGTAHGALTELWPAEGCGR